MNLSMIKQMVTNKTTSLTRSLTDAKPELALAGGLVLGVVAAYKFAVAYKEHEERFEDVKTYISETRDILTQLREIEDTPEGPPVELSTDRKDAVIALTRAYASAAGTAIKLYGPAVAYASASVYLILTSHGIMRGRNKAMLLAAKSLESGFNLYRERIVDRYGKEVDKEVMNDYGRRTVVETVVDEDGKKKKVKKEELYIKEEPVPVTYSRLYDETNLNWVSDPEINLYRLQSAQQNFNDKLNYTGIVLLNEVYQYLGFPLTHAGQNAGWALDFPGDNFIDFGLDEEVNQRGDSRIMLDFNVNGYVAHKLDDEEVLR